nr:MAG TPA: hypothetical protein [Caudoviricetes sp.]
MSQTTKSKERMIGFVIFTPARSSIRERKI